MSSEIIVFRSQTEAMSTDIFLSIANIIRSLVSRIFSLVSIKLQKISFEEKSQTTRAPG